MVEQALDKSLPRERRMIGVRMVMGGVGWLGWSKDGGIPRKRLLMRRLMREGSNCADSSSFMGTRGPPCARVNRSSDDDEDEEEEEEEEEEEAPACFGGLGNVGLGLGMV